MQISAGKRELRVVLFASAFASVRTVVSEEPLLWRAGGHGQRFCPKTAFCGAIRHAVHTDVESISVLRFRDSIVSCLASVRANLSWFTRL